MAEGESVLYKDAHISDKTVLRLQIKAIDGKEFADLRLWGLGRAEKLYPKRQGLCMNLDNWKLALKLFEGVVVV